VKKQANPFREGSPRPIRGRRIIALYREPEDADHRGNPLIQALPAVWDWDEPEPKIMEQLTRYIPGNKDLQNAPSRMRKARLVKFKLEFFQVFERHRYLEENFSILIRHGYIGRNPINPRFRRHLRDRVDQLIDESDDELPPIIPAGNLGFALLGSPGMGKTISVAKILRLYPQVIKHHNYRADPTFRGVQVVWLFLTCPHDSSTRGLCLQFFGELDAVLGTDYYGLYESENENGLIAAMATVAGSHSLGVLVIDEVQFLSAAKSGGRSDLLKFIVQLQNTIGIPVVFVGTHAAAAFLAGGPHQARRSVGIGGSTWDPLAADSTEWILLLEAMWEHQILKNDVPLDGNLAERLYWETQGIPSYAVDLFYFAQRAAIDDGTETITVDSLTTVAQTHTQFSRPYVLALRSRDPVATRLLEDVVSAKYEDFRKFAEQQLLLPSDTLGIPKHRESNAADPISPANPAADVQHQISLGDSVPGFHPPPPISPIVGPTPPRPSQKRRGKRTVYAAGTLMAIWDEVREKQDTNPCEALRAVGLIRSVTEFLPALPAA
jgi:hypothetical protein